MKTSEITFTIPGEPTGKGRPRFVRATGRAFTPPKTSSYENLVKLMYNNSVDEFYEDEPLEISITAIFQMPKSASKKKMEDMISGKTRPTKRPDADNIMKAICDALNGIAYKDDAQIVSAAIRKYYGQEPQTIVTISTIKDRA